MLVASGAAAVLLAAPLSAIALLRKMHGSVGTAPPTAEMLASETGCALFRHYPQLRETLAWRSLGAAKTPVQRGSVVDPASGRKLSFGVKREDLISSAYGGNKVRTLQHQLAVCEAKLAAASTADERQRLENVLVIGTGGSNQVVATLVHSLRRNVLRGINVAWLSPDLPDLDNTLNMLSTLSLPMGGTRGTWGKPLPMLRQLVSSSLGGGVVLPLGGNNPSGVLGQVGGALELAEQVASGEADDPQRIYLPIGSSCTVSGLIIGVAIARRLGLRAFEDEDFMIVGVIIHHIFAAAQRTVGLHTSTWGSAVPLTIGHTIRSSCAELVSLGGPDVLEDALHILNHHVTLHTDPATVGTYGGHSDKSRTAAAAYEASGTLADAKGDAVQTPLWLCGHFSGKAFSAMLDDLRARPAEAETASPSSGPYLLWQTKSAVQPRGNLDEWSSLKAMPPAVRKWADEGAAESVLRPGKVDTAAGAAADYRALMTPLE